MPNLHGRCTTLLPLPSKKQPDSYDDNTDNKNVVKAIITSVLLLLISVSAYTYDRIVAMSPDVADILVALGSTDKVVGKDATNRNPALTDVPAVGMHRNLTPEAILAVKPDLALGSYMVLPNSVYARLNTLNIKAVNVAPKEDIASFSSSITTIGDYVGKTAKAKKLAATWVAGMAAKPATQKRYLLSYDGRYVAGKDTVGDELIHRAGGINAAADVNGLKPLSREGWFAAKPDIIIIADHNKPVIGSLEKFLARPEVAASPAGKHKQVYFWKANDFLRYGLNSPTIVSKLHNLAKKP